MGTAASSLEEVQPPADWQPSSNQVGFRLISPTSDISDPSCRIQQHQKTSAAVPSTHLTPTLERRRNSKVVARNLPPRPRPVPTPSSFYFPTRESEDIVDQKGIQSKGRKGNRAQEEETKQRLGKTREKLQKRAQRAKQCLAACIEEPQDPKAVKGHITDGKTGIQDLFESSVPKDMDLNYNRMSTDTTRSVNAAVTKGDGRKKKKKWEPRMIQKSNAPIGMKTVPFDDSEMVRFTRNDAQDAFEPVLRESHIVMNIPDRQTNSGASERMITTPLDPMFNVGFHHEELYFQRLSAASQYGKSPGDTFHSLGEVNQPETMPSSENDTGSPEARSRHARLEVTDAEIDSPVMSLFMNDNFAATSKVRWIDAESDHPDDEIEKSQPVHIQVRCTAANQIDAKATHDVATEPRSNVSSVRIDPKEAEDWLLMGGLMSPKTSVLSKKEALDCIGKAVGTEEIKPGSWCEHPESKKVIVSAKLRKDSPFRPVIRGFGDKRNPVTTGLIGKSSSMEDNSTWTAHPGLIGKSSSMEDNSTWTAHHSKHNLPLTSRSFDDYGTLQKSWLLPNTLAAARAIAALDGGNANETPQMSRWKPAGPSPLDDSFHSSMMASPGPLLTDQVLCNAAFLFSPSYVGGLDRLQPRPSQRSHNINGYTSPSPHNMITTHDSRSHLPDYSRRSHPPVTIPISYSQPILLRHSTESGESCRERSLDSTRSVRFSSADEFISTVKTDIAKTIESIPIVETDAEAPAVVIMKETAPFDETDTEPPLDMSGETKAFSDPAAGAPALKSDFIFDLRIPAKSTVDVIQEEIPYVSLPPCSEPVPAASSQFNIIASHETRADLRNAEGSRLYSPEATALASLPDGLPGFKDDEVKKENSDGRSGKRNSEDENDTRSPNPSMYWSYRSINGDMTAVTPMLGKKSARLATNSPFLRFKAAKSRFSNPPTKEPPQRKSQKKFAESAPGGMVSSRVTEIDGRLKRSRPLKKMVLRRGSGGSKAVVQKGDTIEKPVFRNPVIMGFKTVSSFGSNDLGNRSSFSAEKAVNPSSSQEHDSVLSRSHCLASSSSFRFADADKGSLLDGYKNLNSVLDSTDISQPHSPAADPPAVSGCQTGSTPTSIGQFMAFSSTPVSPDHSDATDITKRGTLRTPLQQIPEIFNALKLSLSSSRASPEPSPLGSCSIHTGSSSSQSIADVRAKQGLKQQGFPIRTVCQSQDEQHQCNFSSDADVSEDAFATLMNSNGKLLLSPMVSESSYSHDDSELDPFQDELIRPSISKFAAETGSRQSDSTSNESSRFFSNLRRDASLRSLAAESRRSVASGSTTLSAIIQKENLTYLPFRSDAPVKPAELYHHTAPGSLHLSPFQRTPMQASKWRALAAAAQEKRNNNSQRRGSRGVLSEWNSNSLHQN